MAPHQRLPVRLDGHQRGLQILWPLRLRKRAKDQAGALVYFAGAGVDSRGPVGHFFPCDREMVCLWNLMDLATHDDSNRGQSLSNACGALSWFLRAENQPQFHHGIDRLFLCGPIWIWISS